MFRASRVAALLVTVSTALVGQNSVPPLRGPVRPPSRYWRLGAANGGLGLVYGRDTVWVFGSSPQGPFWFRADSSTLARWADSARTARFPNENTARFTYYDSVARASVFMELTRLSADVAPLYQCTMTVGAWKAAILLPADSAQRLFALLHGRPQTAATPPTDSSVTYFDFQVEHQAGIALGSVPPAYPEPLRSANVQGEVLAQFVIDTLGLVDLPTFRVLKSTNPWFTSSVFAVLPYFRYAFNLRR